MTIGIDIRVLGNSVKSGIEEYAENLLPRLIEEGRDFTFKLFYSSARGNLPHYDWFNKPNVKLYKFKYPNNLLFTSSRIINRPFIDKMVGGADVFFFPHFFLSSLSPECKRVTTFHDLSYLRFPEFLTFRKRIWHNLQMAPKWQAKFSDKIIAVSESTKKDLTNFYKIDPARMEVIYSGPNLSRFNLDRLGMSSGVTNFKKQKNLPERFILFLGKLEPRKNIINVIKAFNNLKLNSKYNDVGFVIVGSIGWLCENIIREAGKSKFKNQIIFKDQVSDEERVMYYQSASVFVYPSFFEGFGFPPLEAMSCGTPVITSRNSSLPEVVGDAAIMVDPYDIGELELWIRRLLDDNNLKKTLVARGRRRVELFNWETAAKKTLGCLVR